MATFENCEIFSIYYFSYVRDYKSIEGFQIFQKKFIFTAHADDTTFFLKNTESVINLLQIFPK